MSADPWWDALDDEEAEANTGGVPPYDATEVARFIVARLDCDSCDVLDLGCGTGRLTSAYLREEPMANLIGVDASGRMLVRAREREPSATFVWCDGERLPGDLLHIDGAYCVTLFQHLPDKVCRGYVSEVASRLRRHGRFVFQFVPEAARAERSYPHSLVAAMGWCDDAGLSVEAAPSGPGPSEWRWLVAFQS